MFDIRHDVRRRLTDEHRPIATQDPPGRYHAHQVLWPNGCSQHKHWEADMGIESISPEFREKVKQCKTVLHHDDSCMTGGRFPRHNPPQIVLHMLRRPVLIQRIQAHGKEPFPIAHKTRRASASVATPLRRKMMAARQIGVCREAKKLLGDA